MPPSLYINTNAPVYFSSTKLSNIMLLLVDYSMLECQVILQQYLKQLSAFVIFLRED